MLRAKADKQTAYGQAAPFEPVRADFVARAAIQFKIKIQHGG